MCRSRQHIPMRSICEQRWISIVAFVVIASSSAPLLAACPYTSIFSFGDSFADTGNLYLSSHPPTHHCFFPPYGETYFHRVTGRCSDGRLIIDFIAESLGLPLVKPYFGIKKFGGWSVEEGANFAVIGATALDFSFFEERGISIPTNYSLTMQLNWFKELLPALCNSSTDCHEVVGNSLFLMGEIGGNDFNYPFFLQRSVAEVKTYVPYVIRAITSAVNELIGLGARTLIVPGNLPLGCSINYLTIYETMDKNQYDQYGCLKWLNEFAEYYNQKLQSELDRLRGLHSHANIIYADYYNATLPLYHNTTMFGFTNLKTCCGMGGPYNYNAAADCGDPGAIACDDPSKHIGWDSVHFTEAAYRIIAEASQIISFSDIQCDVSELKRDDYKIWKERILLQLGWMDIDYASRKDESPAITNESSPSNVALYERWERSNWLSVMFIKIKISAWIRGSVNQHEKVRDLLKVIDDQFITSDKTLASTLIMKFSSLQLTSVKEERLVMKMGESALLTTAYGKNKATKSQANQKRNGKIPPQADIKKNGVAERRNQALLDMVRSMFSNSNLSKSLIVESRNAKFLENDLISGSDQLRDLGYEIDYIESQPSTSERLVVVQRDDEQHMIDIPQTIANNPVDQVDHQIPENDEQPVEQHDPQENVDITLRRYTRVRKSAIPSDYIVYLQESDYNIGVKNDLETFDQAMSCKKSNLWYDAMKDEMNSIQSNKVWNLIELPNGAKAIGCKWVFKTKRDSLGNIERYKTRLVAKGFTQKEGIDYTETFSPISKKDSLHIILALIAHFDLQLQQVDVKTSFLNGDLEEEVYMKQPEGFSSSSDDILLVANDWGLIHEVKQFLSKNFDMKDMGDASYVIGIKIHRDRPRGRYQSNPGIDHWRTTKKVMRYFQGTKDYMLIYRQTDNLDEIGYSDSDFAGCVDSRKSTSRAKDSYTISRPLRILCDNSAAVFMVKNNKKPRLLAPSLRTHTHFHRPNGRCSDGRLILDFLAESLGLLYLKPYLGFKNGAVTRWNIEQGVNFAVARAMALDRGFFEEKGLIVDVTANFSL
ncbi:GDSL esterase/lipase isoform C [Glycine soja]|uniref:GDSL esterase/lipase isoform C n=1 Tax=Glycine soja TaxID=3848 RepID=A0A445GQW3_GLYSO|nr:GDSL esterase/lipase isoform C [Glycine soja]